MKILGWLCLATILSLGALGVAYASWSSSVVVNGTVQMGDVDLEYYNDNEDGLYPPVMDQSDNGIDPGKHLDIAQTSGEFIDTDSDGDYDKLAVDVENAYPGYYNECSTYVRCNGSLPIVINGAYITYNGIELFMPSGVWVYLSSTGPSVTSSPLSVLRIKFSDNYGNHLEHGDIRGITFSFKALDAAEMAATYGFEIRYIAELSPP
jgi:predicted ribosomally synthesized peptide with SipW-like signal peptide